jgi:L-aspartate oxidase
LTNPQASDSFPTLPHQFDVLIVGGGAAGLYAALCLPDTLQVGLLTKDTLSLSASDWAQGGIAAAIAPEDSPQLHVEDTLKAGAGLCDRTAVEQLVKYAPDCIRSLVDMGVAFDRHQGQLAMTLEAAHSRRRVLHAADTTGRAIVTQLTEAVLQRPNIRVIPQIFVLDLWLDDQQHCRGVSALFHDRIAWIQAGAVILATGGGGQVFAQTTNPEASTGDGVAIAGRAGALLRDLEFIQFHPTALTLPGAPRFLISEAVRGEGAHLVDQTGDRFAFHYHPRGELAPRDVVSRAIFRHLQQTNTDDSNAHVWLDMRPIDPETIQRRFPNIIRVCKAWGVDVFHEPIPVAPAAHYWMGGIATDLDSQTSITGLYAVGETASTGVHGANRLASNSLLECLVFGAQLRHLQPQSLAAPPRRHLQAVAAEELGLHQFSLSQAVTQLRDDLARLMWQCAGICRQQSDLETAIAQVQTWQHHFDQLPFSQWLPRVQPDQEIILPSLAASLPIRQWSELRNLLHISQLILTCAAFRTESRGGHYRSDYPSPDPAWQAHTLVEQGNCYTSEPILA